MLLQPAVRLSVHLGEAGQLALALFQDPQPVDINIDFKRLALGLAIISLTVAALFMIGSGVFGDAAEKAKRTWIPNVVMGLVLLAFISFIAGAIS